MPSDKKYRRKTPKKRKFCGNQHTNSAKKAKISDEGVRDSSRPTQSCVDSNLQPVSVAENVNNAPSSSATPTTSEKKLKWMYSVMNESQSENKDSLDRDTDSDSDVAADLVTEGHRIIDINILSNNIASSLKCAFCDKSVVLVEVERKGLGSMLAFHCKSKKCEQKAFPTSEIIASGSGNVMNYGVNRRAVFAMRSIGCDRAELRTFCGIMDLPPPVQDSSYNCINHTIRKAAQEVQEQSMSKAAQLEFSMAEGDGDGARNIDLSCDGTWMTPGHSSVIGVATTIGCASGKVLDSGIRSKQCKSCETWKKRDKNSIMYRKWAAQHRDKCTLTHTGSSGSMEGAIVKDIFNRSVEKHNLQYTRFIGDGDTNTYKQVAESQPYGPDVKVIKIECVGHVQKRMGTRLRNLKKNNKGKLSDGKTLGGRGRLTDWQIDRIQRMYGNAIRRNKNNYKKMREQVWAVFFHKASSDSNPMHNFCSDKCVYKVAEKENKLADFKHKNNLPQAVIEVIKPIFRDLAAPELLQKCVEGYTQNPNESLNSLIWKFCPKRKNHGLLTVETAVSVAVGLYNEGAKTFLDIIQAMGLSTGRFSRMFSEQRDIERIKNAQREAQQASHEARIARREARVRKDEKDAEAEGFPYQAGAY